MIYTERPEADEYAPFYGRYVTLVPTGDLVRVLDRQVARTATLLDGVPREREKWAYAPGKWTIREVVGHLADVERVMAYRALRIARGDETELPGLRRGRLRGRGRLRQARRSPTWPPSCGAFAAGHGLPPRRAPARGVDAPRPGQRGAGVGACARLHHRRSRAAPPRHPGGAVRALPPAGLNGASAGTDGGARQPAGAGERGAAPLGGGGGGAAGPPPARVPGALVRLAQPDPGARGRRPPGDRPRPARLQRQRGPARHLQLPHPPPGGRHGGPPRTPGRGPTAWIGHDWGGVVAWHAAMRRPEAVERLAILNAPHPALFAKALRGSPSQMLRSWYAGLFQLPWLPEAAMVARGRALLRRMLRGGPAPGDAELAAYLRHFRTAPRSPARSTTTGPRCAGRRPARSASPAPRWSSGETGIRTCSPN
jgi:hypothetical protein